MSGFEVRGIGGIPEVAAGDDLGALVLAGVEGSVEVGRGEREWRFTPTGPWKDADYQLIVQDALEDLAGNRVGRAFDVDTSTPKTRAALGGSVMLGFRPR